MALGHLWAGRAFGTNTGNIFVKLSGNDDALAGALHLNDPTFGLTVYRVNGSFDGATIKLTGQPENEVENVRLGELSVSAKLNEKGNLNGEWDTDTGSAGTFVAFPHDQPEAKETGSVQEPEQLHTARYDFGSIAINREQISELADEMQADFSKSVVVTVAADTEQSRLLIDFKTTNYGENRAKVIKLYVQQQEPNGVNRVSVVEFGPVYNMAMVQGSDEAWTLGMLEKLKRHIRPLERINTTNFKKLGFGIYQLLFVGAVTYLPSLEGLRERAVLMIGILAIILSANWLHKRFLPHAAIHLKRKPKSAVAANLASWFIALTSALVAALLAAYLQGQFPTLWPQP